MKFINSRKVAFGSLGLVFSLFGANVEGAIAQNTQKSGRYLSNQEIQSFEVEIQAELRSGSRFYLDRRTSLEINQINDFVRAWQKVDPSIAPYLGSWTGFESGVDIYPSSTKGQVCIVSTGIGINQYTFGVGRVSSNKLLLEGEDGKTVIVTKRGILQSGNTINFIVEFGSYNGRNGRSSYIYPRIPRKISTNKLARLGCTTSFPSISTTILSVPTSSKPVKPTNSGDGYPTDAEIQRLSQEFEQILIPEMQRSRQFGLGKRDAALERFTQEWAKSDRSASFFLGRWASRGVDDMYIYPSSNQGKVCIIWTMPARSSDRRDPQDALFSLGVISNGQLKANNMFRDRRKTVVLRSGNYLATTFNRDNVPQVSPYSAFSEPLPTIESLPLANTGENRKVVQQFYDAGCTASLPSKIQAQTSEQKHPAESTVSDFYAWYFKNNNTDYRRILSQKTESFTPDLYKNLDRAIRISDTSRGSGMLNFDVFSNAQVGSYSFQIDSVVSQENSAEVYLTLQTGLGYGRRRPNPIKVLVVKNNNRWQIADFVYLRESPNIYSLLPILRDINQKEEFSEIPWGNYDTIPSVPASSSTPVKQTDTIARYPTNDDFKKVDRILQASRNPESLVNLKGNQQDQRLKFQKEWESRNPAAAKFLGSWYTGDKSFYVYPSTSKGGTCVITKDNQGNLDLQIGAVLNKELRYGGGKGFFWIDRTNIIASRDSNSGDLYPIYATSEVPELSESTISDMQSQKCITTLPTTPVATKQLPQKTSGQLLSNENVACTTEFKTLLGQTASAYCKSSQVDSGLIFDDIKVTKNADRSVKLELRMFNRGSAEGFVEVYDSNKKLQDIKIIDGNKPPTGLLQSSYGLFVEVPASVFSRYPLGDDRRSLKEQILDVTIPAGGYVQITKSSNFAVNYNTAMLLLEISQLTGGDPGFIQEASTKKFLVGFAKEVSSEARINIFKGEVNIQSIASMEFVDKKKLAEVFQKLVKYSASIEKEPSKNPIFSGFSDVILTTGNIGLEQALDVVVPGLGSLSRNVRNGGDSLNVAARAIDIKNSIAADRKATIIFRNPL